MANLDIAERRRPQDGRTKIRVHGRTIDFRVSSLPTHIGEKITLRVLDGSRALRSLGDLGLPEETLELLRDVARSPEGMILVTGPTGSGKTTTLYALLKELTSVTSNIVTIENPVEYQLAGINQVDINDRQGLTFAGVLRSVLRQDPDVILVGEIRDNETAEIAFQAAQTGHLVLSTLHTNDSISTITRLIDLGVEPYLIASSIHLVMAQRLVRRTCSACAAGYEPDEHLLRKLPIGPETVARLQRGAGCEECGNDGYDGRIGLYEALAISKPLGRLIESGAGESQLREQARRDGYRQLLDDADEKLGAGATTIDEVLRVVQVVATSLRCGSCRKEVEEDFSLCPYCGTSLNTSCTSCERRLDATWTRCPYCGAHGAADDVPATPRQERTFKALVVDDDTELLPLLRSTLERANLGLTVVTAKDGTEALALAAETRPDVILIDFSMPGLSGAEVVAKLRQETATASTPVMMLTGYDNDEYMKAGFRAGIDDFVLKPFRRSQLVARVRRMLERSYGSDQVVPAAPVA
jgi:CheY-like chemotaxis protein